MKMKITAKQAGTTLDLLKTLDVPADTLKRQLKRREVKRNGVRIAADCPVAPGDVVEVFVPDRFVRTQPAQIVWQGGGAVIADKPAGADVYRFAESLGLMPAHRLDRNTSGLLLLAETPAALAVLETAVRKHALEKYYYAVVLGKLHTGGTYTVYQYKDAAAATVKVSDAPQKGYEPAVTAFEPLEYDEATDTTRVRVRIETGRTHQIRAFFAHIGHPLVGDGKYGDYAANRRLGGTQRLVAYKLVFGDIPVEGLAGRTIALPESVCAERLRVQPSRMG